MKTMSKVGMVHLFMDPTASEFVFEIKIRKFS
jgi:hypothetical protein